MTPARTDDATADETQARIESLFGEPLCDPPGVLHVTAVWQERADRLVTLRIGPDSPASETDFFSLELARARSDAIVTTGRILREEPEVAHLLSPGLAAWRRARRGLHEPPVSVVLTGRDDLDLEHPLLASAARAIVVAPTAAAGALAARAGDAHPQLELAARDAPGLRDTIDFLQQDRGLASVCIEAGPSTSLGLYDSPLRVDELMLSVFCGGALADGVAGGEFVSPSRLAADFEERHRSERRERSGPWVFRRLVRRSS